MRTIQRNQSIYFGYEPSIIYDDEKYIESFSTTELANFLIDEMQGNNLYISDTNNIELLVAGQSKIAFSKDITFEAKDGRINYQENATNLKLKSLKIDTILDENNIFSREINLEMYSKSASNLKKDEKSFEARIKEINGKFEKDSSSGDVAKYTIKFSSKNIKELSSSTMRLLNVASGVNEKQEFVSGNNIKFTFSEYIDTDDILLEDASFEYTFTPNSKLKDLSLAEIYEENSRI